VVRLLPESAAEPLLHDRSEVNDESGVREKSVSADEIQIKQLERAWNQAEAKEEVGEVSSLLADSLVYTDYDGSFMNKWIASPEQKADHLYDEGINVQVYGDAAVAGNLSRIRPNKGKPYVIRSRFTDTWIKRNAVWRCIASHSTLMPSK
jgi:ketosteroid isomerase-like protein